MLKQADEVGFTPDQKSKLEAIVNAPAPKNPDEIKQMGKTIEDIAKTFTQQQKEKMHTAFKHDHPDGSGNREDNDDHK